MLKISAKESGEPPSRPSELHPKESYARIRHGSDPHGANENILDDNASFLMWVRQMVNRNKAENPSLDGYREGAANTDTREAVALHERMLFSNIIKLRDLTVVDVMIPRADIAALDIASSQQDLLSLLAQKQFSRFPVYRETLDDVVGTIHIKDILACLAQGKKVVIGELVREVPIVSPALPILDLILLMKQLRKHMALVVDEYGGIDGLVTIGDVIEVIIGEVEDEYDNGDEPQLAVNADGSILADGRFDMDTFEEAYGEILTEDEREDIDTLGGLVFSIAGRIPGRGEILPHPSGMVFEIVDADPRRVNKVLIKNIPGRRTE